MSNYICPHCGIDREDACGHPATPAPCWSKQSIITLDLLSALKGVVKVADRDTIEFHAAHAAIRKAEGGE